MASLRETRDRINSVRSTLKITSAMKLVASAKLRKAQRAIESLRPYERTLAEILSAVGTAGPAAIRAGEASSRADGNYFSDKFAEKPISAPPSTTPSHATRRDCDRREQNNLPVLPASKNRRCQGQNSLPAKKK